MLQPLIIGNWKMHGTRADSAAFISKLLASCDKLTDRVELALLPPLPLLGDVAGLLRQSQVAWGAQNVHYESAGAYTGEVSPAMLLDFGCRYALLGHSERRELFNEDNQLVAKKLQAVLAAGLQPILCVGESLQQRTAQQTLTVIQQQLASALAIIDNVDDVANLVVAYEPIWAIGTGRQATPDQAQEVHAFIRQQLLEFAPVAGAAIRLLYGGSVKPDNAADLLAMPDINGALVGGASLQAESFLAIASKA